MTLDYEVVTFDYWRTIIAHHPHRDAERRAQAWLQLLQNSGHSPGRPAVDRALMAGFEAFVASYECNAQFSSADVFDVCIADLGLQVGAECRSSLIEALEDMGPEVELAPGIKETLTELAGAGVRLAVISDVLISPAELCEASLGSHGLLELFDHLSFSDRIGCYKPAPAMFKHALEGLGVTNPAAALHVGDMRRSDVGGARDCGMATIRYTGLYEDSSDLPDADYVIADHAEIGPIVGLR